MDWHGWYDGYDDPGSSLSRRLATVRTQLRRLLDEDGVDSVLSICAGDGRDLLPELAVTDHPVRAVLLELDPDLAGSARSTAQEGTTVLTADAGLASSYPSQRFDLVMACGVFGNMTDVDVRTTIAFLATLLRPGGRLVWTRGRSVDGDPGTVEGDRAEWVRSVLRGAGFVEEAFVSPDDASFRVGVHRLDGTAPPVELERLFTFVR